jgi:hypothetical protein
MTTTLREFIDLCYKNNTVLVIDGGKMVYFDVDSGLKVTNYETI